MFTATIFKELNIRIDNSLVTHVLEEIEETDWHEPQAVFQKVNDHIKEHETDSPVYYVTVAYVFLLMCEVKDRREKKLSRILKQFHHATLNSSNETIH